MRMTSISGGKTGISAPIPTAETAALLFNKLPYEAYLAEYVLYFQFGLKFI